MKKALSLVVMLAMLFSFACAEEPAEGAVMEEAAARQPADLLNLWRGGDDAARVASGIPISDGILLTSVAVAGIPAEQLVISDGARQWKAKTVIPDADSHFAIVFYNPADAPAGYGSWQLLPLGFSAAASSCTVLAGGSDGSRVSLGVLDAEEIRWQGDRCYLLSLTGSAPAGSAVLTADGLLAGMVIAGWAEGINRVLMLPAEEIARGVSGGAGPLSGRPDGADEPAGLSGAREKNRVTIDWSAMTLPETKDGEQVWMVLVDTGNNFLTSFPADLEGRKLVELLTPGRFYIVGPVVSAGRPSELPASYASVYIPQAEPLTAYHFTPVVTAIAEASQEDLKEGRSPEPVAAVTEELLRSGRAWFYSHSTYEVVTTISDLSLLVTLTDPDGNNYRYESAWVYSPDYMKKDIWYVSLKDTRLTEALNENGYPEGVYQVAFYVDGDLADSFTFEMAK